MSLSDFLSTWDEDFQPAIFLLVLAKRFAAIRYIRPKNALPNRLIECYGHKSASVLNQYIKFRVTWPISPYIALTLFTDPGPGSSTIVLSLWSEVQPSKPAALALSFLSICMGCVKSHKMTQEIIQNRHVVRIAFYIKVDRWEYVAHAVRFKYRTMITSVFLYDYKD